MNEFEYVKWKVDLILSSKDPITFWWNILATKDDFINYTKLLAEELSNAFVKDNSFLIMLYKSSNYQKIWAKVLKNYLEDTFYFDLKQYFYYSCVLNKTNQIIAKWLIKKYKWEDNINAMLEAYNFDKNLKNTIYRIFKKYKIDQLEIDDQYLNENHPEKFLEKVFVNLSYMDDISFAQQFNFKVDFSNLGFKDVYKNVQEIYKIFKNREIDLFVNKIENKDKKRKIDKLIKNYSIVKIWWYRQLLSTFDELKISKQEKGYWMWYVKQKIINLYYPEVKKILYYYNEKLSYEDFFALKSEISNKKFLEQEEYKIQYDKLIVLKNFIQKLYSSFTWPFIRPFVLNQIAYILNIEKKDLLKIRYVLWFLFAENYVEFKNIYRFFSEIISLRERSVDALLRLYFINFVLLAVVLWWLFFHAPLIFVLWVMLFVIRLFYIYLSPVSNKVLFNLALNSFIILMLAIWWYFFVKDFDTYTKWTKQIIKTYIDLSKATLDDLPFYREGVSVITDVLRGK